MERCVLCGWLPTEGHSLGVGRESPWGLYDFPAGDPMHGRGRVCGFCASERWGLPEEKEDT